MPTQLGGFGINAVELSGDTMLGELKYLSGAQSAVAGAATLSKQKGVITSESLTTAAAGTYTLTLTNTYVSATSHASVNVFNGTNTGGTISLTSVTPSANTLTVVVTNSHATDAFNGTLKISFYIAN